MDNRARKLNVLFINNDYSGYGASLSMINMHNSIRERCNCEFVITSSNINKDITKDIKILRYGIPGSAVVGVSRYRHILSFLPRLFESIFYNVFLTLVLCRIIKKHKIDIVHTNTSVIICGFIAAKICRVKHVWHLREFIYQDQGCYPIIGFTFLRYLINKSDAVIPITHSIKEFYNTNFVNIFNAVFSYKNILPSNDLKDNYILFCGSLSKGKQPEKAIEAFARVSKEFPKLKLVIAGTGPLENNLKELSSKLGIANRVDF